MRQSMTAHFIKTYGLFSNKEVKKWADILKISVQPLRTETVR